MVSLLFHDLLELARVKFVDDAVDQMQRHPWNDGDKQDLYHKHPLDVARIEILGQQRDRQNVDEESQHRGDKDSPVQIMNWSVDIEQLSKDERWEGDRHDISKGLVEEQNRTQHDNAALMVNKSD